MAPFLLLRRTTVAWSANFKMVWMSSATSEAGARRPAGAINLIWTTYLGNYHNCSTLTQLEKSVTLENKLFYLFFVTHKLN
jgi:hypothetical protein